MNKIFKVIWSKTKNCYVVTSELAKSHTKSPKSTIISRTLVAGVLACVLSCGAVLPVFAENTTLGNTNNELATGDGNVAIITDYSGISLPIIIDPDDDEVPPVTVPVVTGTHNAFLGGVTSNNTIPGYTVVSGTRNIALSNITTPLGKAVAGGTDILALGNVSGGNSSYLADNGERLIAIGHVSGSSASGLSKGFVQDSIVIGNSYGSGSNTVSRVANTQTGGNATADSVLTMGNVVIGNATGYTGAVLDNNSPVNGMKHNIAIGNSDVGHVLFNNNTSLVNDNRGFEYNIALGNVVGSGNVIMSNQKAVKNNVAMLNLHGGQGIQDVSNSVAIGYNDVNASGVRGNNAVGIGKNTMITADDAIAIGTSAQAGQSGSVALGSGSVSSGANTVSVGSSELKRRITNIADGQSASDAVTIGQTMEVVAGDGISVDTSETNSIGQKVARVSIGNLDTGITSGNYILGTGEITGDDSIAVGSGHQVSGSHSGAFGDPTIIDGSNSYSVGNNNLVASGTTDVFALGNSINAIASNVVALGTESAGSEANTISVGHKATDLDINGNAYGTALNRKIVNVAAGVNDTDAVNVSQLNTAIAGISGGGGSTPYVGINSAAGGNNEDGSGATGTNAIAIGLNAVADGNETVALGHSAIAHGEFSNSIGNNNTTDGRFSVAIGSTNHVYNDVSFVLGRGNNVRSTNSVVLGSTNTTETNTDENFVMGNDNIVKSQTVRGIVLGNDNYLYSNGIAIGSESGNSRDIEGTISIGHDAYVGRSYGISIGNTVGGVQGTGYKAVTIGYDSQAYGGQTIAIGTEAVSRGSNSFAIGSSSTNDAENGILLGNNNYLGTDSSGAIAIGNNIEIGDKYDNYSVESTNTVAIGSDIIVGDNSSGSVILGNSGTEDDTVGSIAINGNVKEGSSYSTVLNGEIEASSNRSIAINGNVYENSPFSIALNGNVYADSSHSVALNGTIENNVSYSYAFGGRVSEGSSNSVALGNGSLIDDDVTDSLALGGTVSSEVSNSVALGKSSIANSDNVVSVGNSSLKRRIVNVAPGTADTDAVNVSQLNTAIAGVSGGSGSTSYIGINSATGGANEDGSGAVGTDAIAIGKDASATPDNSTAIGYGAIVSDHTRGLAFGTNAKVENTGTTNMLSGLAIGNNARITSDGSYNRSSIAIGDSASVTNGGGSMAIGNGAVVNGDYAVAMGNGATSTGTGSFTIGYNSMVKDNWATAIGAYAKAGNLDNDSTTDKQSGTAIGSYSNAMGTSSVAVGSHAEVRDGTINGVTYDGYESVAVGANAKTGGRQSVVVGTRSEATGSDSVVLGTDSYSYRNSGVVIGKGSKAGTSDGTKGLGAIVVGGNSNAIGNNSAVLGRNSNAYGTSSIAIGYSSSAGGTLDSPTNYNIAIGESAKANNKESAAIGYKAQVTANDSVSLGYNTNATAIDSVALGSNSTANTRNVISVGHAVGDLQPSGSAYSSELKRRLVNVADGTSATDSATVGQTIELVNGSNTEVVADGTNTIGQNKYKVNVATNGIISSGNTGIVTGGTVYDALQNINIPEPIQYNAGNHIAIGSDQSISAVIDGTVSSGNTGLVNGGQVYDAIQTIRPNVYIAGNGIVINGDDNSVSVKNVIMYDSDAQDTATLNGTRGTKLTNLKVGSLANGSTDAVVGHQLWQTNENIRGFAQDIQTNSTNITNLTTSVTNALSSVSAISTTVDAINNVKADASLNNLTDTGRQVIASAAANAVQEYMASNGGNGGSTGSGLLGGSNSTLNTSAPRVMGFGLMANPMNNNNDDIVTNNGDLNDNGDNTISQAVQDALDTKVEISDFNTALDLKADKDSVYSKDEVDIKFDTKADISYVDNQLDSKADLSYVDAEFEKKADKDSVYTKDEADTLLDAKADKVMLDEKANKDASNIEVEDWAKVLGIGEVSEGNTNLVNGGTVYSALQNVKGNDLMTVDNNAIRIGGNTKYDDVRTIDVSTASGEGRVITGVVVNPKDATSVANVGYVNAIGENIIAGVTESFRRVDDKISDVGANAAAMSALMPAGDDADKKWSLSAAVGHYDSSTAGAVGLFYKPSDNVILNVRGTVGSDENMLAGGVSVALDKGSTPGISKAQMVKTINAQAEKITQQDQRMQQQEQEIAQLKAVVNELVKGQNKK